LLLPHVKVQQTLLALNIILYFMCRGICGSFVVVFSPHSDCVLKHAD